MPQYGLCNGLYRIKRKSRVKGVLVNHYGILDIGNCLYLPAIGNSSVVIHQTPLPIRTDWLAHTGEWDLMGRIIDERHAMEKINKTLENDMYDLFVNNCQHFARYVATGARESTQIHAAAFIVGLLVILVVLAKSGEGT
jgi:hypothetical protein